MKQHTSEIPGRFSDRSRLNTSFMVVASIPRDLPTLKFRDGHLQRGERQKSVDMERYLLDGIIPSALVLVAFITG
eukprot:scaffold21988_cov76-Skeletonema_marinoi.AAC.1